MAKYRIKPHKHFSGWYSCQSRWLCFWTEFASKASLAEAEREVRIQAYLDRISREGRERSRSWRKAVPTVNYDESGHRLKN